MEYRSTHSAAKRLLGLLLALIMLVGLFPATVSADDGDTPETNKVRTSNGDGTYTLELSVKGDSEIVETAANVNVLIVYDTSNSMTYYNVTTNPNRNRADYAEDVMHRFVNALAAKQNQDNRDNVQVAVVTFGRTASGRQPWTSDLSSNTGVNRFFDEGVDGTVT